MEQTEEYKNEEHIEDHNHTENPEDPFAACSKCGRAYSKYSEKQITNFVSVASGLVVLVAVSSVFLIARPDKPKIETPQVTINKPVIVKSIVYHTGSRVTMKEFSQLKDGMTYEAASAVVGSVGTVVGKVETNGSKTEFYTWQNENGSNLGAQFRDDKLVMKTQFNLEPAAS